MKQTMLSKNLFKAASWAVTHVSWMTMVISPVAMGKEAENKTAEYYKQFIHEIGLDHKMTVSDFWSKVKADLPGYAYFEIEQLYKTNPNALMPQFEVKSSKDSSGNMVPVLSFTENGKSHTVQIFGDKQKYLKFDNVVMSEVAAKNPATLFQKLIEADSKLNEKYKQDVLKLEQPSYTSEKTLAPRYDFSTFKGFDRVTPEMWKSMSQEARASYIIQMRALWTEARKVNFYTEQKEPQPLKVKEKASKKTSSLEKMFKMLLVDEAVADVDADNGATAQEVVKVKTKVKDPNADSCVVAGWVSSYGKGNGSNYNKNKTNACSLAQLKANPKYSSNPIASKALSNCAGQNQMACNPMVFGYQANGATICVSTITGNQNYNTAAKNNFQKATWFGGPCDSVNQLTKTANQFNLNDKPGQKYDENQKRINADGTVNEKVADEQIGLIEKDQVQDQYKMTQNFLNSILASKNTDLTKVLNGEWTKEFDDMFVDMQVGFEKEINEAIRSCEVSVGFPKQADQLQKGACDQLHRRWIFTERFISQYRAKACMSPASYNWDFNTNKTLSKKDLTALNKVKSAAFTEQNKNLPCSCEVDGKKITLNFKESSDKCNKSVVVAPLICPQGSDQKEADTKGQCSCTIPPDADNNEQVISFEPKSGLPKECQRSNPEVPVKESCDKKYPPLTIAGGQLNDNCTCKGTSNFPKEDQPGLFAKLFNTKKNKTFKKTETQNRIHSCKFGPNWWAVAGIGVGIAGITALLLMKRKTKEVVKEVPKEVPIYVPINNPVCNTPPRSYWTGYSCECPPCGKYYMADGTQTTIVPNPISCSCSAPPSEGGSGNNDSDSGGIPTVETGK